MKNQTSDKQVQSLKRLKRFLALFVAVTLFSGFNFSDVKKIYYCWIPYQWSSHASHEVIGKQEVTYRDLPAKVPGTDYLEFFAVGCAGSGNDGQRIVASQMADKAENEKISFVLYLGDNFYGCGVKSVDDSRWKKQFEDVYDQKSLQIPFYAVLGNHDYVWNPEAQVEYSKTHDRWKMPERYYTFTQELDDGTRVAFFAIDSEAIIQGIDKGRQIQWLRKELMNSDANWKIVYAHRPIYTGDPNKAHGDEGEAIEKLKERVEPLLIEGKVDLYMSADSHTLEVLGPVHGVHYLVSGGGSRPRKVMWTDQTRFAASQLGFAWFRISKDNIGIRLIDQNGDTLYAYQITKQPESIP